jgi:diadenosine tetraphosphate (Ap4A) HIT family hydrolase
VRDNPVVVEHSECVSCAAEAQPDLPPRDRIYVGPHWRAAHAFGTALRGWLVVLPRRHVLALDELTGAEASGLGPLLRALTAALREVTGCDKTYVALFAEAEGFGHVHFHVIPRHADLDPDLRGPRVFGLMSSDAAGHVPESEMDQIALQLAAALPAWL